MRTLFLAALAASTVLAAPALAQDGDAEGFSGPRVAIIGGWDGIRPGSTEDSDIDGDDQTVSGLLYGVEAGYDFNLGNVVAGVEAEYSDSSGDVDVDTSDPNFFGFGNVAAGRDLYVGGRLGVPVTPSTLLYAKGGYTNARLEARTTDGTTSTDQNFKLDGWRLGAGVEQKIGSNAFAKLEYRYSNYTDADFEWDDGTTINNYSIDTDRHQVAAGVGFRF